MLSPRFLLVVLFFIRLFGAIDDRDRRIDRLRKPEVLVGHVLKSEISIFTGVKAIRVSYLASYRKLGLFLLNHRHLLRREVFPQKRDYDLDLHAREKFSEFSVSIRNRDGSGPTVGINFCPPFRRINSQRQQILGYCDRQFNPYSDVISWYFPDILDVQKDSPIIKVVLRAVNANISTKAVNDRLIHALGLLLHFAPLSPHPSSLTPIDAGLNNSNQQDRECQRSARDERDGVTGSIKRLTSPKEPPETRATYSGDSASNSNRQEPATGTVDWRRLKIGVGMALLCFTVAAFGLGYLIFHYANCNTNSLDTQDKM